MPRTHVVKQGECLASIAERYGFADWRIIYDDPSNERLREARPNPNVLLPGDEVAIPEQPGQRGAAIELPTGSAHALALELPRSVLRLRVLDSPDGEGIQAHYRLEVEGVAEPLRGTIGADGILEASVPPAARNARLVLEAEPDGDVLETFQLHIGALDPVSAPSGVRERLRRLGFDPGPEEGALGPSSEAALRAFQARHGLEETGTVTEETADELVELAGV
jgi:hypothetical protein